MKKLFVTALCATLLVLSASVAHAAAFTFNVFVDTSTLIAAGGSPYAAAFTLIGGDPLANSATITNFDFGGGSANTLPAPTLTGDGTGDLFSTVTLLASPASFFNDFFQGFTPGSYFSFDVAVTTNVNGPTPDAFSFAILDGNGFSIPTTNFADALLLVDLDGQRPALQTYVGEGVFSSVTVAAVATPEPASLLLLGGGLIGASAARRRKRASR